MIEREKEKNKHENHHSTESSSTTTEKLMCTISEVDVKIFHSFTCQFNVDTSLLLLYHFPRHIQKDV